MPGVSDPYPECSGQEQGKEGSPGTGDRVSFSGSATYTDENEEPIITSMKHISRPICEAC